MIVLRDSQQLTQVVQPDIKAFLRRHFHDIYDTEPYDSDEHGFFILVEPGDTSEQIELATGYLLLKICSMALLRRSRLHLGLRISGRCIGFFHWRSSGDIVKRTLLQGSINFRRTLLNINAS